MQNIEGKGITTAKTRIKLQRALEKEGRGVGHKLHVSFGISKGGKLGVA